MTDALLDVQGLTVRYGGVVAVDDVSFSVADGAIVGLIGPNGAGKTSIVDALTGYTRPASGTVRFGGREVTAVAPHRLARAGLTRTFQSVELFDDLTVRENLLAASDSRSIANALGRIVVPGRPKPRDVVEWALALMSLGPIADAVPAELSYGQAKLVGVARALACRPRLLLLDEPAAGLDSQETEEMAQRLRQLPGHGVSVLLIDHDMHLVMGVCDAIVVLDFGRTISRGTPAEVRADQTVIAAYLGSGSAAGAR